MSSLIFTHSPPPPPFPIPHSPFQLLNAHSSSTAINDGFFLEKESSEGAEGTQAASYSPTGSHLATISPTGKLSVFDVSGSDPAIDWETTHKDLTSSVTNLAKCSLAPVWNSAGSCFSLNGGDGVQLRSLKDSFAKPRFVPNELAIGGGKVGHSGENHVVGSAWVGAKFLATAASGSGQCVIWEIVLNDDNDNDNTVGRALKYIDLDFAVPSVVGLLYLAADSRLVLVGEAGDFKTVSTKEGGFFEVPKEEEKEKEEKQIEEEKQPEEEKEIAADAIVVVVEAPTKRLTTKRVEEESDDEFEKAEVPEPALAAVAPAVAPTPSSTSTDPDPTPPKPATDEAIEDAITQSLDDSLMQDDEAEAEAEAEAEIEASTPAPNTTTAILQPARPQSQLPFTPSSSPLHYTDDGLKAPQILCWNHVGTVTSRPDSRGRDSVLDITFKDSASRTSITQKDPHGFIVGSLGEEGGIFATDLKDGDDDSDDEDLGVSETVKNLIKKSSGAYSGSTVYFHR